MASVPYRCTRLYHHVFQSDIPETHNPAPRSVQVEVTIFVNVQIHRLDYLTGGIIESDSDFAEETLRFDLHLLEDRVQAYGILAAMLRRLQIDPDSSDFYDVVVDIIRYGRRIGKRASNRGRMVLPLCAEIRGVVERRENNEMVLMRRAMQESALTTNYGMVPAEESSAKKMLKKVKVKGEDCVICLEEINGGSDASQMPCSHTFHGPCIERWLKQSHYCPMCRFEIPTSQS